MYIQHVWVASWVARHVARYIGDLVAKIHNNSVYWITSRFRVVLLQAGKMSVCTQYLGEFHTR